MTDGKGTVTVGLSDGACIYCGKIGETRYGACEECMGEVTVLSAKIPHVLAERFREYREERGGITANAAALEIVNPFFGYGRAQRPLPKDKAEAYGNLIECLRGFPEYPDLLRRVREDFELFRLPDSVRETLPLLNRYPKEFGEILSLVSRRPAEMKALVGMPEEILSELHIFGSYPEEVRLSLKVVTAYPELSGKLLSYLEKGSLIPEEVPSGESAAPVREGVVP